MIKVNLFFDESGKDKKDTIKLMGSLMIPEKVYNCEDIVNLNNRLKKDDFKLHWTQYDGGKNESEIYKEIINVFSRYISLCGFNVIRYDYPEGVCKQKLDNMIYSKLPERVMYGLLRYQGKGIEINADIYVEEATMYKSIKLHETLCREMNRQSLYRGTNFIINGFEYKKKNEEIGVELTDVLLGIIRNIIINRNESKRLKKKNMLITELLKNRKFNEFIRNIKYFEWNYSSRLNQIEFSDYVDIFLSNQNEWIEYLSNGNI